jgi:hypothetical protein
MVAQKGIFEDIVVMANKDNMKAAAMPQTQVTGNEELAS